MKKRRITNHKLNIDKVLILILFKELSDLAGRLVTTNEGLPSDSLETSINISQFGNNPQIIFTTPEV